ncbi:MAG: hypothetical protein LBJ72_00790, partial [Dysgonamonadaceae bacterium]|nr:hypothetical protein [Dysgonamonadaceae bacterium]
EKDKGLQRLLKPSGLWREQINDFLLILFPYGKRTNNTNNAFARRALISIKREGDEHYPLLPGGH